MIPPAVRELRTAAAVRERCAAVLGAGLAGELTHFRVVPARLDHAVRAVADQIASHGEGPIAVHGRLNHLRHPSLDAAAVLVEQHPEVLVDAVVVSVLLDAGAGASWRFDDPDIGPIGRSEGLALAAYRALAGGSFSSRREPFHVDAAGLVVVDDDRLAHAMQHRPGNELVGLPGRAELLRRLGTTLSEAGAASVRSLLFDDLGLDEERPAVDAGTLLTWVLDRFSGLWPSRLRLLGHDLGDTWVHPAAGGTGDTAGLVPFHKLSQWLTYSLVEPLGHLGVAVADLDQLTGLAEYRNGGMLVELGVVEPRAPLPAEPLTVDHELVVEWRALTVALLDRIVEGLDRVLPPARRGLGMGQVLEAGTWPLGRRLAYERSPTGASPIPVRSDGTVF